MAPDAGITNLHTLLQGLTPVLHSDTYVFCVVPNGEPIPATLHPIGAFREAEGQTLIVSQREADQHGLAGVFPCAWITLEIHSSLAAVGLMAAVSAQLAQDGIACNVVSAYFHDHLFVPVAQAQAALAALRDLQSKAGQSAP